MGMARNIFHITTTQQWLTAQKIGLYTHESIIKEGFIHCSYQHQVLPSAQKHFSGQNDLIVLCISVKELKAELRVERGVGSMHDFPHIYGEINLDAVKLVINLNQENPDEFLQRLKPFAS